MTSAAAAGRWAGLQQTAADIDARARRANPALVALTLAIAVPVILGWLARKIVLAVWWVASRAWTAVLVGWEAAGPKPPADGGG